MDYCQRAEELEVLATFLLKVSSVDMRSKKILQLQIDCAGMSEEELEDYYGTEVANLIIREEYYDASVLLERNKNESYSEQ